MSAIAPQEASRRFQRRRLAISAPSLQDLSFAQVTSGETTSGPAEVAKPQSVPAITRDRSPTTATASQIRDYIVSLHDFAGVNGVYDYRRGDQHGLGIDSVILVKWNAATGDVVAVSQPGGRPQ